MRGEYFFGKIITMSAFFTPKNLLVSPIREYAVAAISLSALALDYFIGANYLLFAVAVAGSLTTLYDGVRSLLHGKITIDSFNAFALSIALITGEIRSTVFIVLMLVFASLLDWYMESRRSRAVEEVLRLKPTTATREKNGALEEVPIAVIKAGDIVLIKEGGRIPVDGVIILGEASVNEASLTGESILVEKRKGDAVWSSTLVSAGTVKVKATKVGKESTVEQIAALIKGALKHKSHSERIADRFAAIFLPVVVVLGAATYAFTGNIVMTAALFLVACADDIAVAIPLAMSAAIGKAAERGVIIKGGEWLAVLARIKTVVMDKTGTLTYGDVRVEKAIIKEGVSEKDFWTVVGVAEKFSDHPAGRAIYAEAVLKAGSFPDPEAFKAEKGSGIFARYGDREVLIGNLDIFSGRKFDGAERIADEMRGLSEKEGASLNAVFANGKLWGYIVMRDISRPEARRSVELLKSAGVERVVMFTGDNKNTAERIAAELGIADVRSEMKPEQKLGELEKLFLPNKALAMVGDGVNDAPALARADIGIAMGGTGTAVAIEAADVVILSDRLDRLPEMIRLGKKTMSVVRGDMVIWLLTNLLGFYLVFTGVADPAFAAFYNFISDFFPLINSARLFRKTKK